MNVEATLALVVMMAHLVIVLLVVAHLRLRHRHRRLCSTLRRVAAERNSALWAVSQAQPR